MKAAIHREFVALRHPGDKKNSKIEVGEVVEGPLAKAAIDNGFGEEVDEKTPIQNRTTDREERAAAGRAKAEKRGVFGKGKAKGGEGGEGEGE